MPAPSKTCRSRRSALRMDYDGVLQNKSNRRPWNKEVPPPVADFKHLPVPKPTRKCMCRIALDEWSVARTTHAQRVVLIALKTGISKGSLEIIDPAGCVHKFGNAGKEPEAVSVSRKAVVHVKDDQFWLRVYLSNDLGFSEAYMAGECDSPDLKEVLNLYIDNLQSISTLSTLSYKVFTAFSVIAHFLNVAGYDASNELYMAFLSKEMQYSCPIWTDKEGGVRGDLEGHRTPGDLEAAQATKINHILRKARLTAGGRLLEIGSGWGSVAIAAAKMGCTVDTLTLSVEQKELAEKRIEEAGFFGQIRVHFMDYRDMPPHFKGVFDACVSLEMLERRRSESNTCPHIFRKSIGHSRTRTRLLGQDFVRKFHWPHTVLTSALSLAQDFQKVLGGRFCIDSIEDFGTHYPRCLREWGRRLHENWTADLIDSLQRRYPELKDPYKLEMFRRKWFYMFTYMEVAYSRVWLSCFCWTLARPGDAATKCA
ncbi:S-adenosyl-L-methionine-dependent methyltransferase [Mycena crocata]|nr:S-adenosyl-L-methionine-dependent methyltransferase [Mycena crocata]